MSRIVLTPAAREEVRRATDAGEPAVVTVSFAGGCGASGFLVRLTRRGIPEVEPFEVDGCLVTLDGLAEQRLDGATIDFAEADGFSILHPDAVEVRSC